MIDSYSKLTVGKYLEVKDILQSDMEDIDKSVQLLCVLGDYDEDTVLNLPVDSFSTLIQSTGFLYDEPKPRKVSDKYKLGDMELVLNSDVNKMTIAQFIDYQTFVKDERYIVELLSVFLTPKGSKYNDDYDIEEVKKAIRDNLSILDAMGISAFFLLVYQKLLRNTVTYSIRKLRKMERKEKDKEKKMMLRKAIQNLVENGDGCIW